LLNKEYDDDDDDDDIKVAILGSAVKYISDFTNIWASQPYLTPIFLY